MLKGPQNYVVTEGENGALYHDLSILQHLLWWKQLHVSFQKQAEYIEFFS